MRTTTGGPWIATILVVDQIASTRFAVTHGDTIANAVIRDLIDAGRSISHALEGRYEKSTGDGFVLSFDLASVAIDAAIEIQRSAQRLSGDYPEPVLLRVGLAVGEVEDDGADLRGWPLVHASRLCDAASDGTILASQTVIEVIATRLTHELGAAHVLDLKGFDKTTQAVEIVWEAELNATRVELGSELIALDSRPWVGRPDDLNTLLNAFEGDDPAAVAIVTGEPGAGKSRLIARFAREYQQQGRLIAYGASRRDQSWAYAPIIAALHSLLEDLPPTIRALVLAGRAGRELSRLLPDLAEFAMWRTKVDVGPEQPQLLLDAIAEVLRRLADMSDDAVLIIDDVQWADGETLATIRHLIGPSGPDNVSVVVACRSGEAGSLHDLWRLGSVVSVELAGLAVDDIASLVAERRPDVGAEDVDRIATQLAERTGGNALFVTSLIEHLDLSEPDPGGSDSELPAELSAAISDRLSAMDPGDVEVLEAASVIGHNFSPLMLSRVMERSPVELGAALGRAQRAGLVQDLGSGVMSFSHDLVRSALAPPPDTFHRAALHRSIGEHMARDPAAEPAEVAGHHLAGLDAGADRASAALWCESAAERATRRLAFTQAQQHYLSGLEVIEGDTDSVLRLKLGLGRSQLYGGDPTHRSTLLEVVAEGLAVGRIELAASAALANNRGFYSSAGAVDVERIGSLRDVLAAGPDSVSRSMLMATLAVESLFDETVADDLVELSASAVELARSTGDALAVAKSLTLRQDVIYRIDNIDTRMSETAELLGLTANMDPVVRFWALAHRVPTMGEAGDWDEVTQLVAEAQSIAVSTKIPLLAWYSALLDGALALKTGDLDQARDAIDRSFETGFEIGQPDAIILTGGQFGELLRRRGEHTKIHALAAANFDEDLLRRSVPMRAVLYLEEDRHEKALELWNTVGLEGALAVPDAQVGHNLLHARRLCRAFDDQEALRIIEYRLRAVPPFLFCNYWEPTADD